jgi:hypothetical protein
MHGPALKRAGKKRRRRRHFLIICNAPDLIMPMLMRTAAINAQRINDMANYRSISKCGSGRERERERERERKREREKSQS